MDFLSNICSCSCGSLTQQEREAMKQQFQQQEQVRQQVIFIHNQSIFIVLLYIYDHSEDQQKKVFQTQPQPKPQINFFNFPLLNPNKQQKSQQREEIERTNCTKKYVTNLETDSIKVKQKFSKPFSKQQLSKKRITLRLVDEKKMVIKTLISDKLIKNFEDIQIKITTDLRIATVGCSEANFGLKQAQSSNHTFKRKFINNTNYDMQQKCLERLKITPQQSYVRIKSKQDFQNGIKDESQLVEQQIQKLKRNPRSRLDRSNSNRRHTKNQVMDKLTSLLQ